MLIGSAVAEAPEVSEELMPRHLHFIEAADDLLLFIFQRAVFHHFGPVSFPHCLAMIPALELPQQD